MTQMNDIQEELLTSLATKGVESLATKADLAELEGRVMVEIAQSESRVMLEIAKSEGRVMVEIDKVTAKVAESETRATWRIVGATGVMIVAVGLMIQFLG